MTSRLSFSNLALWIASHIIIACSKHPEIPEMPPLWSKVFMYPFSVRHYVKRDDMTEKNIFPATFTSEVDRNSNLHMRVHRHLLIHVSSCHFVRYFRVKFKFLKIVQMKEKLISFPNSYMHKYSKKKKNGLFYAQDHSKIC